VQSLCVCLFVCLFVFFSLVSRPFSFLLLTRR
jgi:hypothetical protein